MTSRPDEVIAASPHGSMGTVTTAARSTLLGSSIIALKSHGHFDAYLRELPKALHEAILLAPAATWVPIDHAVAHYAACDRLMLSPSEILAMGNAVASLTQKSIFSVTARLVREAGASPTVLLAMSPRLWSRLFLGGSVVVRSTGPKDARLDIDGTLLADCIYWRVALRGLLTSLAKPFCRQIVVREQRTTLGQRRVTLLFSWV